MPVQSGATGSAGHRGIEPRRTALSRRSCRPALALPPASRSPGAFGQTRTDGLLLTTETLCRWSYEGTTHGEAGASCRARTGNLLGTGELRLSSCAKEAGNPATRALIRRAPGALSGDSSPQRPAFRARLTARWSTSTSEPLDGLEPPFSPYESDALPGELQRLGCRAETRTPIHGFRDRCPAIRRQGIGCVRRQGFEPVVPRSKGPVHSQTCSRRVVGNATGKAFHWSRTGELNPDDLLGRQVSCR